MAVLFSGDLGAMIFLCCYSFPVSQLSPSKTFIRRYFGFLLFIPPAPIQQDGQPHPLSFLCPLSPIYDLTNSPNGSEFHGIEGLSAQESLLNRHQNLEDLLSTNLFTCLERYPMSILADCLHFHILSITFVSLGVVPLTRQVPLISLIKKSNATSRATIIWKLEFHILLCFSIRAMC